MKINILFAIALVNLFPPNSYLKAQGIRGGEMMAETGNNLLAMVDVKIYREGPRVPFILFDWGDGTTDTLTGSTALTADPDVIVDFYFGTHQYDTFNVYILSVQDSFLIPDIANIPNSGSQAFYLRDTFGIDNEEDFFNNIGPTIRMPNFIRSQVNIEVAPNGAIIHDPIVSNGGNYFSYIVEALVPFPAEGYAFPEATDSLVCCITWDQPLAPGKYAFGIRAYSYRRSDDSFFGTTTRLMTIEVDSSMITSGLEIWEEPPFDIFPNPAAEAVYLQFDAPPAPRAEVHIYDMFGRKAYSGTLDGAGLGRRLAIPVAGWPPGMYVAEVRSRGRVGMRKFVVGAR